MKVGKDVVICDQCGEPCNDDEVYYHGFIGEEGDESYSTFCSIDPCLLEHLGIDEYIIDEVDRRVKDELKEVTRLVGPRSRARLRKHFE